jgi:hypothetical protein
VSAPKVALKVDADQLAEILADYGAARRILRWLSQQPGHDTFAPDEDVIHKLARDYATNSRAETKALDAVLELAGEDC